MLSFESQNVVKFHLNMNEETYSLTTSQDIILYYK